VRRAEHLADRVANEQKSNLSLGRWHHPHATCLSPWKLLDLPYIMFVCGVNMFQGSTGRAVGSHFVLLLSLSSTEPHCSQHL
jgi:hypothetical protein